MAVPLQYKTAVLLIVHGDLITIVKDCWYRLVSFPFVFILFFAPHVFFCFILNFILCRYLLYSCSATVTFTLGADLDVLLRFGGQRIQEEHSGGK